MEKGSEIMKNSTQTGRVRGSGNLPEWNSKSLTMEWGFAVVAFGGTPEEGASLQPKHGVPLMCRS